MFSMIRRKIPSLILLSLLVWLPSCSVFGTRVIYVKDGQPVRLAETVKAKVWVPDKDGKLVKGDNRIEIQEGWYALPDPGAKKP